MGNLSRKSESIQKTGKFFPKPFQDPAPGQVNGIGRNSNAGSNFSCWATIDHVQPEGAPGRFGKISLNDSERPAEQVTAIFRLGKFRDRIGSQLLVRRDAVDHDGLSRRDRSWSRQQLRTTVSSQL